MHEPRYESVLRKAMALSFDLVPPESKGAVLARLKKSVEYKGGHLTTGVMGPYCLMNALWRNEAAKQLELPGRIHNGGTKDCEH
ncbi:MAG: hypothetical protein NTV49_07335 [Kiritimatiellaeota bacterium]|nr:hypothetical protein [Kiritimatiellota bacterium]